MLFRKLFSKYMELYPQKDETLFVLMAGNDGRLHEKGWFCSLNPAVTGSSACLHPSEILGKLWCQCLPDGLRYDPCSYDMIDLFDAWSLLSSCVFSEKSYVEELRASWITLRALVSGSLVPDSSATRTLLDFFKPDVVDALSRLDSLLASEEFLRRFRIRAMRSNNETIESLNKLMLTSSNFAKLPKNMRSCNRDFTAWVLSSMESPEFSTSPPAAFSSLTKHHFRELVKMVEGLVESFDNRELCTLITSDVTSNYADLVKRFWPPRSFGMLHIFELPLWAAQASSYDFNWSHRRSVNPASWTKGTGFDARTLETAAVLYQEGGEFISLAKALAAAVAIEGK